MKKILLDVVFGFVAIIVITILEFVVTLPFGEPNFTNTTDMAAMSCWHALLPVRWRFT